MPDLRNLFATMTKEMPRTIKFTALYSSFGLSAGNTRGVILDGCENTHEEIENLGQGDFLGAIDDPDNDGLWVWEGTARVHRFLDGDYDIEYTGKWTALSSLDVAYTIIEKKEPEKEVKNGTT